MLLILAYSSDYTRWRFPFIALGFFFTFCGFVVYAAIDVQTSLRVAYFACFMMVRFAPPSTFPLYSQLILVCCRHGEPPPRPSS